MSFVNFDAPAGVFETPHRSNIHRQRVLYKRFGTLAEAVEYVMEYMPDSSVLPRIEIEDLELNHADVRKLYEDPKYPLRRVKRNSS